MIERRRIASPATSITTAPAESGPRCTIVWHIASSAAPFTGERPSSAIALVHNDGSVKLIEGSPDIGGTRTSVSQQFAEVLGIPITDINPTVGDTDSVGFTSVTGGSGVTFKTGRAAYEVAQEIKRKMCERAAKTWNCPVEEVEYQDGYEYLVNARRLNLIHCAHHLSYLTPTN